MVRQIAISLAVLITSWMAWHIAAKKGMALVKRKPAFLPWSLAEEFIGTICIFALADAYVSKDLVYMIAITAAGLVGCAAGCLSAKVILWDRLGQ